jgi:hypothetical protein
MKTPLLLSTLLASLILLGSCGGSSSEKDNTETASESEIDSNIADGLSNNEAVSDIKFDSTQIETAEDAMEQYKNTFNQYAESVKSGTAEERAALKEKLDKIMAYSKEKWSTISFKAMDELAKVKAQLDLGNNVDVQKAKEAFNKSFEEFKNLPAVKEDAARMKQEASDFMDNAKKELQKMKEDMNSADNPQ